MQGRRGWGLTVVSFPQVKWQLCISVEKQVADASQGAAAGRAAATFTSGKWTFILLLKSLQ